MWTSTQNVFGVRQQVASILGLDVDKVRVLAEDVGGGFGAKGSVFPEEILVALAAWRLKRPVRWVASRSEDSATTAQGHGSVIEMEIAADRNGKLRGLRGRVIHDIGAYAGSGTGQPGIIVPHMMSAYVLPAMEVEHQLVYTNTVPTGFIRGGGRPAHRGGRGLLRGDNGFRQRRAGKDPDHPRRHRPRVRGLEPSRSGP
jgi:carbon-monoxide dehydrogenase large subunit